MLDAFTFGLAELSVKLGISAAAPERTFPQPASNVQLYLAETILPKLDIAADKKEEIPPEGHRAHKNILEVKRELFRNLSRIVQVLPDVHDASVLEFAKERISSVNLSADTEGLPPGDLTVQCPQIFKVAERTLGVANSVAVVRDWVHEYPLASVQRALHLQFPETRNFALRPLGGPVVDADKEIALWYTWSGYGTNGSLHTKMVVMIQPPWIAAPADVDAFVGCTEFPKYDVRGGRNKPFHSWERIWAQMWDVCRRQKCHWFVYTTYESWVFGCFSPAWSGAHVTSVKKAQAKSPTVLQSLVYWFAASMGMTLYHGPTEMPEFTEDFEMAAGTLPPHQIKGPIPPPPASESVWTARSSARDTTSEFGGNSESRLSRLAMSDTGIPERLSHTPRPRPGEADDLRKRVTIWKETHDGIVRAPPSEAGITEHTETSIGTVTLDVGGQPRAFRNDDREIDWVQLRVPM